RSSLKRLEVWCVRPSVCIDSLPSARSELVIQVQLVTLVVEVMGIVRARDAIDVALVQEGRDGKGPVRGQHVVALERPALGIGYATGEVRVHELTEHTVLLVLFVQYSEIP